MTSTHCAWGGRSHAFLLLRVDLPLVGRKISFATNGSAPPKASARNEVAAPRVVGTSRQNKPVESFNRFYEIHFSNRIIPIGAAFECADTSVRA